MACQLIGRKGDSGPCILKDEERAVFQNRGINSFVISVTRPLGDITTLKLWHDNHGISPSWFLKKAVVCDCQTGRVWIFLADTWLAVDEGDGNIMRELSPATDEDKTQFTVLFREKIDNGLSDAHLWFSVIYKTPRSRFTRVQRITCCLNLLCTGMVASAMFFGQVPEGGDPDAIALGPIKLSLRCIMIGIQSSLVILPVNIAIMTLFQKSKRKDPPADKRKQEEENELGEIELIPTTEVKPHEEETDSESESEMDTYSELDVCEAEIMRKSLLHMDSSDEVNVKCKDESGQDKPDENDKISLENVECDIHGGQHEGTVSEGTSGEKSGKARRWFFGRKDRSKEYLEEGGENYSR